jgi:hypothetical protein
VIRQWLRDLRVPKRVADEIAEQRRVHTEAQLDLYPALLAAKAAEVELLRAENARLKAALAEGGIALVVVWMRDTIAARKRQAEQSRRVS